MNFWKLTGLGLLLILLIAGWVLYDRYRAYLAPNVPGQLDDPYVEIPTGSTFEEVLALLSDRGLIVDTTSFRTVAERLQYARPNMRAGRFQIQPGWNNLKLVRHLRGGPQATVPLVLTTERLPEEVARKVSRFIEPDSADFMALFTDEAYLQQIGYRQETLLSLFIPNTYDFYWNTSVQDFMERMQQEHERFWGKDNRRDKAAARKLSLAEVYTLASIVEKETNANIEKRRIAGVYLNRLAIGMPLQADPTCVFATRDFDTPRVTDYHLKFDSPYNTYLYRGLPPGPIAMASIASIDAVLNAEAHDYLYFCAVGDGSGLHLFAKSLAGHNQNAERYRANLRQRGLR